MDTEYTCQFCGYSLRSEYEVEYGICGFCLGEALPENEPTQEELEEQNLFYENENDTYQS